MKIIRREASMIAVLVVYLYSAVALAASTCEDSHSIKSVNPDGTVIKLEDGTVWRIDLDGAMITASWKPTTKISVCDCITTDNYNSKICKFTNNEDNNRVDATLDTDALDE